MIAIGSSWHWPAYSSPTSFSSPDRLGIAHLAFSYLDQFFGRQKNITESDNTTYSNWCRPLIILGLGRSGYNLVVGAHTPVLELYFSAAGDRLSNGANGGSDADTFARAEPIAEETSTGMEVFFADGIAYPY